MQPILLRNMLLADCNNNWRGEAVPRSLIIEQGKISWIGSDNNVPSNNDYKEIDLQGRLVTPGLIDCHTHLIYGGERSKEYQQRLQGVSYQQIAGSGGGILSTVAATRAVSEDNLYRTASKRLQNWLNAGFTTVEIKSGYGLNYDTELKMLSVAKQLGEKLEIDIHSTLLAAHTLPVEFTSNSDGYIDWIINELMPEVCSKQLASAVDVFCENIGFSLYQSKRLLNAAKKNHLQLKIHAEQLSNCSAAEMAATLGALSADHLEYVDDQAIAAMQANSTVAVLLPIAFYFLREKQLPPIKPLMDAKVDIALASDANPGSAPILSPLLTLNMATTLFKMTTTDALKGLSINAAKALGVEQTLGSIEVGKRADIAIWDLERAEELSYWIGGSPLFKRIYKGHL